MVVYSPALAQTATETKQVAPGPATILKESAKDFAGLGSFDALMVLGIGAAGALAVHPADDDVNWQLGGSDYRFLGPGRLLGHASVQGGLAVATYLAGRAIGEDSRAAMIGQQLIRAQLVTQLSTFSIKAVVGRQRPDGSNNRSFPSGHASTDIDANPSR